MNYCKLIEKSEGWKSTYKSKQGNIGLGVAICYYTSKCIPISIPLNDTQGYDLIVDLNNELKKVQIKTTQHKSLNGNNYMVLLKNTGGSSGNYKTRFFDKNKCDILFVVTNSGDMYEIPTEQINVKNALTLNDNFECFKIT